jgi:hypothetical protein
MAEEDSGGKGNATDFLTKKAGPLPVGVWIALVAGGLGVTYYLNRGKSSAATVAPGPGTTDATGSGTYQPVGGSASNGAGSGGNSTSNTFADNNAWGTASVNYLISLGYDPGIANQAIALYLSSQPLTTQQQAMVNSALQHFGVPPLIPAPTNGGNTGGGNTGGNSGTMTAPGNLHVNKYAGGNAQLVWTADTATDTYDVLIKSEIGGQWVTSVPGPHVALPTGIFFPLQAGHQYTATVTPKNASGAGPVASVGYTS